MKSLIYSTLIYVAAIPVFVFGQEEGYRTLINLPVGDSDSFGGYVNMLYLLAVSLAAILAVIKLIIAGIKYMLSDVVTSKQDAKNEIKGALVGLLIIIAAVVILNEINPNIADNSVGFAEKVSTETTFDPFGSGIVASPGGNNQPTAPGLDTCAQQITNPDGVILNTLNCGIQGKNTIEIAGQFEDWCNTQPNKKYLALTTTCVTETQTSCEGTGCDAADDTTSTEEGSGAAPTNPVTSTCNRTISQRVSGIYTIHSQNLQGCTSAESAEQRSIFRVHCNGFGVQPTGSGTLYECRFETSKAN